MGCPCCDVVFRDNKGNDILKLPVCPLCNYDCELPEQRIEILGAIYHTQCVRDALKPPAKTPPRFDPAIFR